MARRSLETYQAKRDFTKTKEPSGMKKMRARKKSAPIFCVQKHLASSLHYDFRLEHNGTLLSWAVPKGPSTNPKEKRLAMQVEDHPIDYADFEGVIAEGYGAGIVVLWDKGTWSPEMDDVDAALKKGDFKFTLKGKKLKGSWVLVRTRGWPPSKTGESRSWLLIKHRDKFASEADITVSSPKSVKSKKDFVEILAADKPAVWESDRPGKGGAAGKLLAKIIEQAARIKSRKKKPAKAK